MKKNIFVIVLLLSLFACESIPDLPHNNPLDPESTTFNLNVGPKNFSVETVNKTTVKINWEIWYLNNKTTTVEVVFLSDNDKILNTYKVKENYLLISDLDTTKTYKLKARVSYDDFKTKYSKPIVLNYIGSKKQLISSLLEFEGYNSVNNVACGPNSNYFAFLSNKIILKQRVNNYSYAIKIPTSSPKFFFTKNGRYFVIAKPDSKLEFWEKTKIIKWLKKKEVNNINVKYYSASNKKDIIAVSNNDTVKILDVPDGNVIKHFVQFKNITALKFNSDGNYLFIATSDNTINMLESENWTVVKTINTNETIDDMDISSDNKLLLYISGSKLIVNDLGKNLIVRNYSNNNKINKALFASRSNNVIMAIGKNIIRININDKSIEDILLTSKIEITDLDKDKNSEYFVSSGQPVRYFLVGEVLLSPKWVINLTR